MSSNGATSTKLPRPRSATVFDGPDRAHARAYMKGVGYDDDALSRPTIGIANTWAEANSCNFHLRGLAEHVKEGVRAAGGTPLEFNTVAISDGITMGTQGMKASLVSREVIADSIELMARGYQFDAIVALCACDKTIPGCAMALARLDIPSVVLYGGSIAPGHWHGRDVTILDIFEAIGAHNAGDMSDEELNELEGVASPGAGACGGQFTANTMACAFEALGISAGGSAMVPAEDEDKATVAEKIGELVINVLAEDITPSKVITRDSLENSIACVCASGGSTNAVLHLIALAHELDIELDMDDFERISRETPLYADLKPGGRFVATDLYAAGGVPVVLKRLAEKGVLHEDALTVTGKTIGEVAEEATEAPGQEVVRPLDDPLKPEGGLAILGGNLAPEGAVVKLAGTERHPADRPRPGLRVRRGVLPRGQGPEDQRGRRRRDPQRGPGRRPRHARDAPGHRRDRRRGPWRERRDGHRRPLLGRHPRPDDRPRRPRGRQGRPDRRDPRGRRDHRRHRRPQHLGRPLRRGDRRAHRRLRVAALALRPRCDGEVRRDRQLGLARRRHRRLSALAASSVSP